MGASVTRPVLVAGATGLLGRLVVAELRRSGVPVRVLSRRAASSVFAGDDGIETVQGDLLVPASLERCCEEAGRVVSCAGASLDLYAWRDRRSYDLVDRDGNLALLEAARRAGAAGFTYVSVFGGPAIDRVAYVAAHRDVERALSSSGLEHRIVRPTGFFGFHDELFRMAGRGFVPVIGDGSAKTNPIDERDLAAIVAHAFDEHGTVIEAGGPDVLSRRQAAELAAEAAGTRARIVSSPPALWNLASRALSRVQPRLSDLFEFAAAVSSGDFVAPARGGRRLVDHFRDLAAAGRSR